MILLILITVFMIVVYLLNRRMFTQWSSRGFKQLKTTFFFGNAGTLVLLKKSMGEYFHDLYLEHKDSKLLGIYFFYQPTLIVTDPKLVEDIMVRDFECFHDRPMSVDEKNDPLSGE